MPNDGVGILTDAIARNIALVLSLPSAGMLRHHKSRFLAETETGFWVESVTEDRHLVDDLISRQAPVGISFKNGVQKLTFAVPITERNPQFRVNADTVLEAIQLTFPPDIKAIQRRNDYRVPVPLDSELRVRIWRIPEHAYLKDRPLSAQELPGKLRDISTGGLGVALLPKDKEPPRVIAGERLRISLLYGESDELILEGRLKHRKDGPKGDPVACGIQFKKLENNLEGRQHLVVLTRIVGELQREEARRVRMGLKNG